MKKTFLIVWLVMMIILAISAVSFAEEVTLRLIWWGGQLRIDNTLKVIELFEEKYPNVKIEPEFLGYAEYWQRMGILAAAKDLPDVIQLNLPYFSQYVKKDLLLNLDPYVEDNRLDLTNATEAEILGGRLNGSLYGVNCGTNTNMAYVYDPELFQKAGVEEPTPDWTWEDYIEKAKKIHDVLGIYGDDKYLQEKDGKGLQSYLRQYGKDFYDKSGKKLGYEDDSLFVDYFTMIVDLVKDGVYPSLEVSLESGQSTFGEWLITKQEAAMQPICSSQLIALLEAAGRPLIMTTYPNAKDQVQYTAWVQPSMSFSVAKTSKYPEWAVKFIDFYTNDLEANKISLGERGVPISSKIREGLKPYLSDAAKQTFDFIEFLTMKYIGPVDFESLYAPKHPQVIDLYKTIYEKMLAGELTPEEAAKEFRKEANKILAES